MDRAGNKHSIITIVICFLIAVIEGIDIQAAGIAAVGIRESFGLIALNSVFFLVSEYWGYYPVH